MDMSILGPGPGTWSETGVTLGYGEDVTIKEPTSETWKWQLPLLSWLLLAADLHTPDVMCISEIGLIVVERKLYITAT